VRALRSWVFWWLVLFGLWNVLQGAWEAMEIAAGAGAAALGATLAELARRERLLRFAPSTAAIVTAAGIPRRAVSEFWTLTWALALQLMGRRRLRGAWVAVPFAAGGDDPRSAGDRAVRAFVDNVTPNTLVADVDCERDIALKHDLVRSRAPKTVP
jgi:multisubunit Na+/H+ antiporter MnhE subunit